MTTKWYAAVLADMKTRVVTDSRTKKQIAEHQECWNHMLDIGIGTGSALAANSAAIVANRVNVVGIDYDAAYIKKAEAVIQKVGLGQRARVHCCSIFEERLASRLLAENENRFDTAYFSGSFTLLQDPAKALQICRELVKPNGYIYITQTFQTTRARLSIRARSSCMSLMSLLCRAWR